MKKQISANKRIIFDIANSIPEGKVATYGMLNQIFNIVHLKNLTPLVVGYILSSMKEEEYNLCAWQRVVGKSGTIPTLKLGFKGNLQISLLESEGVEFIDNKIDMATYCIELDSLLKLYKSKYE